MSEETFRELHERGLVTSHAFHPGRDDDWEPDIHAAINEPSLDQANTRAEFDRWGWEYHDGELMPGGFASDPFGD